MTLKELATLLGIQIEILYPDINGRWYVHLKNAEIMERGCLCSATGRGNSPEEAMVDYVSRIAGTRVAIDAFSNKRREFSVPGGIVV